MQLIESDAATGAGAELRVALFALAIIHDVASLGFVSDLEMVAGFGNTLQAENFDGRRRFSFFYGAAMIVEEGAHFSEDCAADEEVAGLERAVLNKDGGDGAAAFVHAGFKNGAAAGRVGIGFEFAQIGDEKNNFEQAVQTFFLFGGNFDEFGIAAPVGGHQAEIA